uniref:Uncharacterized protein n=1 Tax=Podarcis muralis TaxID=64176 RepID=A0A670I015_PODMU
MASSSSTDVGEEATCPICMEYLTDPVTLDCGHNFCRDCIVKYFDTWEPMQVGDLECPVCKARMQRGSFRSNWQLANIVEKIKFISPNKGGKDLCKRHREKLHLFCKEDEELVCFVCERSPEHKSHTVVLKEEVAQEYKTLICDRLEDLKREREKIMAYEAEKLTESQRQDTLERFKQLHQFLDEQEKRLLNEIEEMEKEITIRREEHLARLSEELSSLERSIWEMEEKSQQPASELLQVRLCGTSCRAREPCRHSPEAGGALRRAPRALGDRLTPQASRTWWDLWPANVTLDPDTAHPCLILSEDQKSVRCGDKEQDLPNKLERFNSWPCVLGYEGFTAGRHFWEVTVNEGERWTLGVARKSVQRKGFFPLRPEGGVWVVGKWFGEYRAFTSPDYFPLSLSEEPRRIRVTLDYEEGYVSLSNADSGAELHTFSGALFFGETLLPFFCLWGNETHLRISC